MTDILSDERLAEIRAGLDKRDDLGMGLKSLPVTTLRALIARLDKAEEALRPFAALADAYFHRYETRPGEFREAHCSDPDDRPVYAINRVEIKTGALRAARSHFAANPGALHKADDGWQDISTARKDGTWVMICNPCWSGPMIAFWSERSGWDDGDWHTNMQGITHWMPLPPLPVGSGRSLADATSNKALPNG